MAKKPVTKSAKAEVPQAETPKATVRPRKKATPAPAEVAADAPRPSRARSSAPATVLASPGAAPTAEQIATRAYFRFLERGDGPGSDLEDWIGAEADLRDRRS